MAVCGCGACPANPTVLIVAVTGSNGCLSTGAPAVLLETAHPAKFPEEIEKNLGFTPDVPPALIAAEKLPEDYDRMGPDYEKFRSYLIQRHAAA